MVCNGMGERITDKNLFEPGVWLTEFLLKWCLTLEINIPRLFSLAVPEVCMAPNVMDT